MKNHLLFALILIVSSGFASKTDSTFQRHQISFAVTNGISLVLLNPDYFGGYESSTTTPYYPYARATQIHSNDYIYHQIEYLPNYSFDIKIKYSVGLSKTIRLESGIGYLMQGLTIKYYGSPGIYYFTSTTYCYISMLVIPLHIKFTKPVHKGSFICTLGPNLTFPFNDFYKTTDVYEDEVKQPSQSGHEHFNSISDNASLGFDLKMGYEKELTKAISIDICPSINFTNLLPFYDRKQLNGQIPDVLQSYVGLDVAFNFNMDGLRFITKK